MSNNELKQQIVEHIDNLDDDQLETVLEIMKEFIMEPESDGIFIVSPEQKEYLEMSEEDIIEGRIVSEKEMKEYDAKWKGEK